MRPPGRPGQVRGQRHRLEPRGPGQVHRGAGAPPPGGPGLRQREGQPLLQDQGRRDPEGTLQQDRHAQDPPLPLREEVAQPPSRSCAG